MEKLYIMNPGNALLKMVLGSKKLKSVLSEEEWHNQNTELHTLILDGFGDEVAKKVYEDSESFDDFRERFLSTGNSIVDNLCNKGQANEILNELFKDK